MKKQRKFLLAGAVVTGVVGYLMVTGMRDSMVYYHTPTELLALVSENPQYHERGVKVGGRVVPGTVRYNYQTLDLRFEMVDIETGMAPAGVGCATAEVGADEGAVVTTPAACSIPVSYQGPLPDTFTEESDVVVEGRLSPEGVFQATVLTTKCGSRYEAVAEDYLS